MHRCYLEEELSSIKLNKEIIWPISETGMAEASILLRSKESLSAYKPFINRFGKRKTVQLVLCFPVGPAARCACVSLRPWCVHTDPEIVSATNLPIFLLG